MDDRSGMVSPELAAALSEFRRFLVADDAERTQEIERSDPQTLSALAQAVEPLYGEINAVLDRLVSTPHPLAPDQEQLESDLNSLAQAAMEASQDS